MPDDRPLYSEAPEWMRELHEDGASDMDAYLRVLFVEARRVAREHEPDEAKADNDALSVLAQTLAEGVMVTSRIIVEVKGRDPEFAHLLGPGVCRDVEARVALRAHRELMSENQTSH
jgi:hypothetical protein